MKPAAVRDKPMVWLHLCPGCNRWGWGEKEGYCFACQKEDDRLRSEYERRHRTPRSGLFSRAIDAIFRFFGRLR